MNWFKKIRDNIVIVQWGIVLPLLSLCGIIAGGELSNYTLLFFLSIGVAHLLLKGEGVK